MENEYALVTDYERVTTTFQATVNLRFRGGMLEQEWIVWKSTGKELGMYTEWRPVPQVDE